MKRKLAESIKKNNASYILRNLKALFQKNEDLQDHHDIQIKSSLRNQSGIYVRNNFYKKISKF